MDKLLTSVAFDVILYVKNGRLWNIPERSDKQPHTFKIGAEYL